MQISCLQVSANQWHNESYSRVYLNHEVNLRLYSLNCCVQNKKNILPLILVGHTTPRWLDSLAHQFKWHYEHNGISSLHRDQTSKQIRNSVLHCGIV